MKVLLINIDSKNAPNIALKKIEKYHIDKGDSVIWDNELFQLYVDKIYVSCVFTENRKKCLQWENKAEIGGTGYDIYKTLPEEIEIVKPKINYGFTTRGCPRNCYFCVVPKKEGKPKVVGDIYDFWDGKSKKIVIIDNNILSLPDHFIKIAEQLIKENLHVDFNQGLDHRFLTPELCNWILKLKHSREIRFAFDDILYKPTVIKAIDMLRSCGLKNWQSQWYVYAGEKDTFQTIYDRVIFLRENKQLSYVMLDRNKNIRYNPEFMPLRNYANTVALFKTISFEQAIEYYANTSKPLIHQQLIRQKSVSKELWDKE